MLQTRSQDIPPADADRVFRAARGAAHPELLQHGAAVTDLGLLAIFRYRGNYIQITTLPCERSTFVKDRKSTAKQFGLIF